jgi:hypothetical protein
MRKTIGPAFTAAVVYALLAACAQAPAPIQPLPPGPTADEVADYARAQVQYRYGLASGNGDDVMQATNTFSLISREILSRQDPRLFDAQVLCEGYRVAASRDGSGLRSTYEPQFVQDCRRTDGRYNQETLAIRRHLEAKIAATGRATIREARAGSAAAP